MATRDASSLARWRRQAIRRIGATRRATLTLVARLPASEVLRPRTQGRWSIKDTLAHFLSCDEETTRRFRLIARGRADGIHWFESMADADRFNARSVARLRRVGLRPLLRRMDRVHRELLESLQRLPARSLDDPSHAYTVMDWLPAPGWSHEREHMGEVRAWWRQRPRVSGRRPKAR
jgi:DinB superfamily